MYILGCQIIRLINDGGIIMINKQNIWFAFLFSIILVLSILYVGMGDDDLSEFVSNIDTSDTTLVVNESTELVALRIQNDEEILETINSLQEIILSTETDLQAKNEAYDNLIAISNNKVAEEKVEKMIKEEFKFDSFVKINGQNVTIVIDSNEHNYELANNIIRLINEKFNSNKYITVKFN